MISTLAALLIAAAPAQDAPARSFDAVRDILDSRLTDYPSARFRRVRVSEDGANLCGEVNSRTPAGGYGGWAMFSLRVDQGETGFRMSQSASVFAEIRDQCAARTDWRSGDFSSDIDFET